MKKLFTFLGCLLFLQLAIAQPTPENLKIAQQLLQNNQQAIGLSAADLAETTIKNSYFDKTTQAQLVYLLQTYKGLNIHNQYQVLAFKNGQLRSNSGGRINMLTRIIPASVTPSINAQTAINTALQDRKLPPAKNFNLLEVTDNGRKLIFDHLGVSRENVTAELLWVADKNSKAVYLAWQLYIVPNSNSDYWQIRVDAHKNKVLEVNNLTVYCNWDDPAHLATHQHSQADLEQHQNNRPFFIANQVNKNSARLINGASYRVIPFPAESPIHPGGTPAVKTDPWLMAPGSATTLKWHSTGTNDYSYTRGNNVWAKEDRAGNNGSGNTAGSTTSDPLTFDFTPDFTVDPTQVSPVQNQQFNITNLFYWNNILHDISYVYGFDEASANFQTNNQGRGGVGNDQVMADAQDGSGTSNANFATPADGGSGRMQMYLWNGNPRRDGDVDNGIIAHEFTHGISNRLTGGGSSGCLNSAEQMGEGWSDYVCLMVTQDWANAQLNDGFNKPRAIGTYAAGQSINGSGIRSQKYCTNFAVNNKTYGASIPNAQHNRGEIWCATLWDMTWNIIQQTGTINPNLFDANGTGGNVIAMKLMMQGLKLQPCDPGFIDGRDGILAADQLLYNGQYRCAIMAAFARRGMGFDANQGSAYSNSDQTPGFSTAEINMTLTQNVNQQIEGQQVTYTHQLSVGSCSGLTNHLITDTLPANVTYVSGGSYNAATRVVSFPVTIAAGASQSYAFTVSINAGSYYPTATLLDEKVTGTTIPASWTTNSISSLNWVASSAQSHSAANAFFAADNGSSSDFSISNSSNISLDAHPPILSFWHSYNTEAGWDGGVVEISTNNGVSYTDLGPYMIENPYNAVLGTGSNLSGRNSFSGNSNGFIKTSILLDAFANQNIRLRFRFAGDNNTGVTGWFVDDILLLKEPRVKIRANLFDAASKKLVVKDISTLILENPMACTNVSITTEPVAQINACPNSSASITVVATGTNAQYQWQQSPTGRSGTFTDISGATSANLNIASVTTALNNYAYRVIVKNSCPSADTSTCTVLIVNNEISISTQPQNVSGCAGQTANFSITASGTALTYQWQQSTNGGSTYTNLSNATSASINLTNISPSQNGNLYRVLITGACSANATASNPATLTVYSPASLQQQPQNISKCIGNNVSFSVSAIGTGLSYQWQISTNAGSSFSNIAGEVSNSLSVNNIQLAQNGNQYRVVVSSSQCSGATSNPATLSVTNPPQVSISTAVNTGITPNTSATLNATASPAGNYTYQWFLNTVAVNSNTGANLTVGIDDVGSYTVTVTDANTGCTATSNALAVTEVASTEFYIYPSPNNGQFKVRYYNSEPSTQRTLNIYDTKGAKIYSKPYSINAAYTLMEVNLSNAQAGIYLVELRDKTGKRIALGKVIIN